MVGIREDSHLHKMRNKYNARKTLYNGRMYDSQAEARMARDLQLLEKAGQIRDLEYQVKYVVVPSHEINGKRVRAVSYIADFRFYDVLQGRIRVLDQKGMKTPVYQLKKKLMSYNGVEVEESI